MYFRIKLIIVYGGYTIRKQCRNTHNQRVTNQRIFVRYNAKYGMPYGFFFTVTVYKLSFFEPVRNIRAINFCRIVIIFRFHNNELKVVLRDRVIRYLPN